MGSGNCAFWAPEVFEVADDAVAVVLDIRNASIENVMRAVEGCPTQSISVRSDDDEGHSVSHSADAAAGDSSPQAPKS
jgi:ferredoxin